jgi:hypothetical protein
MVYQSRIPLESRSAEKFRRDASLVLGNAYTLPYILGIIPLPEANKKTVEITRPYSELQVGIYMFETVRILIQALVSFLICLPIFTVLVVGVLLYDISKLTKVDSLAYPLDISIHFVKSVINTRLLRVTSPSCEISTPKNTRTHGIHENRSILTAEKTFIAVPQAPASRKDDSSSNQPLPEVFFYINGICEQGAMVTGTAYLIEQLTGRMCNQLLNPSDGMFLDLLECMIGRDLSVSEEPTRIIVPILVKHLAKNRKVVIIAHSQGGIILTNVLKELVLRSTMAQKGKADDIDAEAFHDGLARLEAYSFCSAADEFPGHETGLFAEHFGAELDFVSRFGSLTFSGALGSTLPIDNSDIDPKAWFGKVYMLEKKHGSCQGHLMKQSILPALKAGLFARDSMFWKKYCDKTSDLYNRIDHHVVE